MEACMYCARGAQLENLAIPVCELRFSCVYLLRDQKHPGRCVVASKRHIGEVYELTQQERNDFFEDVAQVAQAISQVFSPDKINYAAYGDLLPHFHVHLVPKKRDGLRWGEPFCETDPKQPYPEERLREVGEQLRAAMKKQDETTG